MSHLRLGFCIALGVCVGFNPFAFSLSVGVQKRTATLIRSTTVYAAPTTSSEAFATIVAQPVLVLDQSPDEQGRQWSLLQVGDEQHRGWVLSSNVKLPEAKPKAVRPQAQVPKLAVPVAAVPPPNLAGLFQLQTSPVQPQPFTEPPFVDQKAERSLVRPQAERRPQRAQLNLFSFLFN